MSEDVPATTLTLEQVASSQRKSQGRRGKKGKHHRNVHSSRALERAPSSRKRLKLTTFRERLNKKKQKKIEKKIERHKTEIQKIRNQLDKYGHQYLGPPEEDHYWNLLLFNRPYRRDVVSQTKSTKNIGANLGNIHFQRYMVVQEAVEEAKHQVQRLWLELFSDLIFVGAIVKFASQIKNQYKESVGDTIGQLNVLSQAVGIFIPFFTIWLELNVVLIRFADLEGGIAGIIDDFLLFVFMLSIILQAVQIQTNDDIFSEDRTIKLVFAMIASVSSLFFLHLLYRIRIASARKYATRRLLSYGFALLILFTGFFGVINKLSTQLSFVLSSLVILYTTLVSFRVHPLAADPESKDAKFFQTPTSELFSERFGIFTMILIGESILALMIEPEEITVLKYLTIFVSFGMMYAIKLIYFESHAMEECHALNEIDVPGSSMFVFSHMPLGFALLGMGVGFKLLFAVADVDKAPESFRFVMAVSVSIAIGTMLWIRTSHEKFIWSRVSWLRLIPIFLCPVGIYWTIDSADMILWCFLICMTSLLMDLLLVKKYETKAQWTRNEHEKAEFLSHPEEYNVFALLWDFIRGKTNDRTLLVTLTEERLHHGDEEDDELNDDKLDDDNENENENGIVTTLKGGPTEEENDNNSKKNDNDNDNETENMRNEENETNITTVKSFEKDDQSEKLDNVGQLVSIDAAAAIGRSSHSSHGVHSGHSGHSGVPRQRTRSTSKSTEMANAKQQVAQLSKSPSQHQKVRTSGILLFNREATTRMNFNSTNDGAAVLLKSLGMQYSSNRQGTARSRLSQHGNTNSLNINSSNNDSNSKKASFQNYSSYQRDNRLSVNTKNQITNHQSVEFSDKYNKKKLTLSNKHVSATEESIGSELLLGAAGDMQHKKEHLSDVLINVADKPNGLTNSADKNGRVITKKESHHNMQGMNMVNYNANNASDHEMSATESVSKRADFEWHANANINVTMHEHNENENENESVNGSLEGSDMSEREEEEDMLEEENEFENSWFGEFSDLIYVAIIINFAAQMSKKGYGYCDDDDLYYGTKRELCWLRLFMEAALFFFSFFVVWYELSVVLIRFTNIPGIWDDLLKFLYLTGIVSMGLQLRESSFLFDNVPGFCVGMVLCIGSILTLHVLYYRSVDNCQEYCLRRIIVYGISCVVLIICGLINDDNLTIVCLLCVNVFVLWISCNSFRVVKTPNGRLLQIAEWVYDKFVERFGLFVMVTSGESILVLMTSTDSFEPEWRDYLVCALLFAITYGLRDIYFEGAKIIDMQDHALMVKTSPGSVVWTLFHGILGFSLTMCGAGWKLVFKSLKKEQHGYDANKRYLYILGFALAGSLFCMYIIRWAHRKFVMTTYSFCMRVPVLVAMPLGALFFDSSVIYSGYLCFWVWFTFVLDHLLIEKWQTEIRTELKHFYVEKHTLVKGHVNREKSINHILPQKTLMEMQATQTNLYGNNNNSNGKRSSGNGIEPQRLKSHSMKQDGDDEIEENVDASQYAKFEDLNKLQAQQNDRRMSKQSGN